VDGEFFAGNGKAAGEEGSMIETLDDFIREYKRIRDMGWISTHLAGSAGVGRTLEDLLGIPENNRNEPDFGEYELKSCRMASRSMLTIFTKAPEPEGAVNALRLRFGYASGAYGNDEKVLHATLSANRLTPIAGTGYCLGILCRKNKISVIDGEGREYAYWTAERLAEAFNNKYKNKLVYARAKARGYRKKEEFHYTEAYVLSGFDYFALSELLEQGKIYVDLRVGQFHGGGRAGQIHDHGIGFRIKETDRPLLFHKRKQVV